MEKVYHEIEPFFNKDSEILILGSIPSVKSRELNFYYAHPQNKFWKTLAKIYNEPELTTINEKKEFLTKHKIALWDVIESCEITGSSDNSIKNVIPNDINFIITNTKVTKIFTTGNKAYELYNKYCLKKTKIKAIKLPSTSPANCRKDIENILYNEYLKIKSSTN